MLHGSWNSLSVISVTDLILQWDKPRQSKPLAIDSRLKYLYSKSNQLVHYNEIIDISFLSLSRH